MQFIYLLLHRVVVSLSPWNLPIRHVPLASVDRGLAGDCRSLSEACLQDSVRRVFPFARRRLVKRVVRYTHRRVVAIKLAASEREVRQDDVAEVLKVVHRLDRGRLPLGEGLADLDSVGLSLSDLRCRL